jgi:type II secretory pathway component PulM
VIRIRTRTLVLAVVAFVTLAVLWVVVVGPLILNVLKPH